MLADLAAFVSKLEAAIDDTMQGAVAEGAKEALQEAAYRQVYDTYTPQFLSRRGNAGGIADPGNMTVNYGGMTLTITDDAPCSSCGEAQFPENAWQRPLPAGTAGTTWEKRDRGPFTRRRSGSLPGRVSLTGYWPRGCEPMGLF